MGIFDELVEFAHRLDTGVDGGENGRPLGQRLGRKDRLEVGVDAGAPLAGRVAVGEQVWAADGVADLAPELGLKRADREVAAVGRRIVAVAGDAAREHLAASDRPMALGFAHRNERPEEREHPFGHGDVDVGAGEVAAAMEERRGDAEGGIDGTAGEVGDLDGDDGGRMSGRTSEREDAGQRHIVEVVTRAQRERAVLAVAGDAADDELRVERTERIDAEPEPLEDAGAEALDQDVGPHEELAEEFEPFGRLEVEPEALFAPVDRGEEGAVAGGVVVGPRRIPACVISAVGALNLDDTCTEVGEEHGAEGAWEQAREVDDSDAAKGVCGETGEHVRCPARRGKNDDARTVIGAGVADEVWLSPWRAPGRSGASWQDPCRP